MVQKKICMLGAFAVGKTSLVERFVNRVFSEKYLTTIGVKIDKKTLSVDGKEVSLLVWDIYGEDEFQKLRASYLRGSSGYILVADGTRRLTLETAMALSKTAEEHLGKVPFVLVVNKADLSAEWEIDENVLAGLSAQGWLITRGSAKTGQGVEEIFLTLAKRILELDR